jgi:hypothetical protein
LAPVLAASGPLPGNQVKSCFVAINHSVHITPQPPLNTPLACGTVLHRQKPHSGRLCPLISSASPSAVSIELAASLLTSRPPEVRLIVEVDGGYHARRSRADESRDRKLSRLGWSVLRLPNELVIGNLLQAVALVRAELASE